MAVWSGPTTVLPCSPSAWTNPRARPPSGACSAAHRRCASTMRPISALIGLMVDAHRRCAALHAPEGGRARGFVHADGEQGSTVVGPDQTAIGAVQRQLADIAAGQVL